MKAEGTTSDDPRLTVEALDATVVEASADVREDAFAVLLDRVAGSHESRPPRRLRPLNPLVEFLGCDVDLSTVQDREERLLEQVGAVDRQVLLFEVGEFRLLEFGEIPMALLQRPPSLLEVGLLVRSGSANLLPTDFVKGIVDEALNVEAIEDERCVGDRFAHRLDVGAGHVDGDRLDLLGSLFAEHLEEGLEGLGALASRSPETMPRSWSTTVVMYS